MDIFVQKKFLVWTVALLLLLNIASLAMLWYHHSIRNELPASQLRQGPPLVQRFLEHELGLSDTQKQAFEKLRKEHFEELSGIQKELHEAKRGLMEEVTAAKSDSGKVEQMLRVIGEKEILLERSRFEHFVILKNICTPDQQKKYKELLRETLEAAARPEGPPHPGPKGRLPHPGGEGDPPPREMP